jgi:glycosyltransferase involved in cell wall biosynthesis
MKARWAFRLADRGMPVSEFLKRAIEQYGVKARFQVVPNCVDTNFFFPAPERDKRDGPVRLLWTGEMVPCKGLGFLWEALACLDPQRRDYVLDVLGDGPEKTKSERRVAELGLTGRVFFHGYQPKAEVAKFMRNADLFVLPSLVETFSVVSAEALTCGVPVVVTRCGGPEEFMTDQTGMLVPPGDAVALAAALNTMIDRLDSFDRAAIAKYAKQRFSREAVAAAFDRIYAEVVADKTAEK